MKEKFGVRTSTLISWTLSQTNLDKTVPGTITLIYATSSPPFFLDIPGGPKQEMIEHYNSHSHHCPPKPSWSVLPSYCEPKCIHFYLQIQVLSRLEADRSSFLAPKMGYLVIFGRFLFGQKWMFIFVLFLFVFQKCHFRRAENVMFATEP